MKNITISEVKKPCYKTGIPEVGECFKHGSDVYIRVNQQRGEAAFNHIGRPDSSFYAVDLSNGNICWFIGDNLNAYFILDTSLVCSKILIPG